MLHHVSALPSDFSTEFLQMNNQFQCQMFSVERSEVDGSGETSVTRRGGIKRNRWTQRGISRFEGLA